MDPQMTPKQFGSDLATVLNNVFTNTDDSGSIQIQISDNEEVTSVIQKLNQFLNPAPASSDNTSSDTSASASSSEEFTAEQANKLVKDLKITDNYYLIANLIRDLGQYNTTGDESTKAQLQRKLPQIKENYAKTPEYSNDQVRAILDNSISEQDTKFIQGLADNYANEEGLYKDNRPNQYLLIKHAGLVKQLISENVSTTETELNTSDSNSNTLIPDTNPKNGYLEPIKETITEHVNYLKNTSNNNISEVKRNLLDTLFHGVNQQIKNEETNPDLALLYDLKQVESNHETIQKNFFDENSAYNVKKDDDSINQEEFNRLNKVIDTYKNCLSKEEQEKIETLKNNIDIQKQDIDNKETERSKQRPKLFSGSGSGPKNSYVQSPGLNWDQLKDKIATNFDDVVKSITVNYNESEEEKDAEHTQINKSNLDDLNNFTNAANVTSVNLQYKGGGQATYYPAKSTNGPNNNQPTFKINHDDSTPEQIKNAIKKTLALHNKGDVIELNLRKSGEPGVNLSEFKQQLDLTEKDKKTDSHTASASASASDDTNLTWQDYAYLYACQLGLQPKCIAGTKLSSDAIQDIGERLKQQAKEPSSTVEFK